MEKYLTQTAIENQKKMQALQHQKNLEKKFTIDLQSFFSNLKEVFMYVDAVATQSEVDTFDDNEKMVRWNGHAVVELYEMGDSTFVQRIVQNQESKISLRKRDIRPMMQVVRDGEVSLDGDVDNKGNWKVGGSVTFRFGGKEESDNKSENNNDTYDRPDPPDSRDRDFDKN